MVHTHKEIVGIRIRTSDPEELHEIVELAMDITTNSNWAPLRHISQVITIQFKRKQHTTGCTFDSS
jgi:hypothetical protein